MVPPGTCTKGPSASLAVQSRLLSGVSLQPLVPTQTLCLTGPTLVVVYQTKQLIALRSQSYSLSLGRPFQRPMLPACLGVTMG